MKNYAPRVLCSIAFALLFLTCVGLHEAAWAQVKTPQPGVTLSPVEKELLDEINLLRTRPSEYAAYLEGLKPFYKGNEYRRPGATALLTNEGWKAVEEAIQFLRAVKPLKPVDVSGGMCSGAGELAKDQKKTGSTGHKGTDGSFCEDRVTRYGTWASPIGENLSYGNHTARERVFNFLIDDGVSNRNHRKRLLDPGFKVAGVACGEHNAMGSMCVITLAGGFTDKLNAARPTTPTNKTSSTPSPSGARRY